VKARTDRGEEIGFGLEVGFEGAEAGLQAGKDFGVLGEKASEAQVAAAGGEQPQGESVAEEKEGNAEGDEKVERTEEGEVSGE